jgi:hypothetical protein
MGGKEKQIVINAQAQKSVDECLAHSQLYRPLISMVLSEYERMPESWKVVSPSLLLGRDEGGVEGGMAGFRCIQNLCNMDPMSFYQPFIHYTVLLVDRFGLSFPERVGLIAAIEILPNISYYFAAAAKAFLHSNPRCLHRRHRDFGFGYLVATLMLDLRRANTGQGTRFNTGILGFRGTQL